MSVQCAQMCVNMSVIIHMCKHMCNYVCKHVCEHVCKHEGGLAKEVDCPNLVIWNFDLLKNVLNWSITSETWEEEKVLFKTCFKGCRVDSCNNNFFNIRCPKFERGGSQRFGQCPKFSTFFWRLPLSWYPSMFVCLCFGLVLTPCLKSCIT